MMPQSTLKGKKRIEEQTPEDALEEAFIEINSSLADELLDEILKLSPYAFEQMVLDLMAKMGYGAFENAALQTPVTCDGGIDGIIMEDKLGFNLIYVQTKLWSLDRSVGSPDIQRFVGAINLLGGKGLFVTSSTFTQHAISYAKLQQIVLIDGPKLARLMIEHNFGVTVSKSFEIKSVDTDVLMLIKNSRGDAKMQLGILEDIDIRTLWKHEQYDFSEWLSKPQNIERLGEVHITF